MNDTDLTVAPENADQLAAWDGAEGRRWTDHADRYDRACRAFDRWLFDAARVEVGEAILDIGCGAGISTREAGQRAAPGPVLGIDLSRSLLGIAQARAADLPNVRFVQADAQVYPFAPASFDVAISRFGCMFFQSGLAALRNVANALRPQGRLRLLTWRPLAENEWVSTIRSALSTGRRLPERPPGLPGPFGMADPTRVTELLREAGYDSVELRAIDEPVHLGENADDAFAFVRGMGLALGLLDGLDAPTRTRALAELERRLAARAALDGVTLRGAAWLVSARRKSALATVSINGT